VGNQTGGRVGFFLHTDNFAAAHRAMASRGVKFLEEPRSEAYGVARLARHRALESQCRCPLPPGSFARGRWVLA
jgi:hypothetical protein